MFKYLVIAIIIVLIITVNILIRIRANRLKKLQEAAYEILKEEALNKALQNNSSQVLKEDVQSRDLNKNYKNQKRMIHLAVVGTKPLISYVFNPEQTVHIGRNKEGNTICLKDTTVSSYHCDIYIENGSVYIKDLGSANRTFIKRRGYLITLDYGESSILQSKDFVIVGGTRFRITLFDSDIITL